MTITFDGVYKEASPEPSSKVGFATNTLVRDAENRDDTTLPNALKDPKVGLYLFGTNGVVLKNENQSVFSPLEAEQFLPNMEDAVLLGTSENGPRIAASINYDVGEDNANMPKGYEIVGLRQLLYQSEIAANNVGAIAQGNSILYWHATHQYCGKCGTKSVAKIGGYRRDCPKCEHIIFPRTDPVVIMLSIKGDKCLMGRSPHFAEGMYSTLAGFVEPGETIEDAVRRETFEESGIKVGQVKYFASQPWPFQHSLMIGVHCEGLSDDIHMDESELEDCRWFTRDEVKLMIKDEHPEGIKCPPSLAIASALINAWALN
ncbi:MAG: NAD(+) diphosphatase [Rhizobiales bacterium]|nr:NAD(+) diphosphatase [Hyphomicrobiales bacterium]